MKRERLPPKGPGTNRRHRRYFGTLSRRHRQRLARLVSLDNQVVDIGVIVGRGERAIAGTRVGEGGRSNPSRKRASAFLTGLGGSRRFEWRCPSESDSSGHRGAEKLPSAHERLVLCVRRMNVTRKYISAGELMAERLVPIGFRLTFAVWELLIIAATQTTQHSSVVGQLESRPTADFQSAVHRQRAAEVRDAELSVQVRFLAKLP